MCTDAPSEGTFVSLVDGTSALPAWMPWAPDEPNNYGSGENCAMYRPENRYLNDVGCYSRRNYVCKAPNLCPTPPSAQAFGALGFQPTEVNYGPESSPGSAQALPAGTPPTCLTAAAFKRRGPLGL